MERRDVVDAEFRVVEGPGRIKWGSVLWHSGITMFAACIPFMAPLEPVGVGLLIIAVALQWPIAKMFSFLSEPLLSSQSVEPLAERLKRGTRTKL